MIRIIGMKVVVCCLLVSLFATAAYGQPALPTWGEGTIVEFILYVKGEPGQTFYDPGDDISLYAKAEVTNTEGDPVTFILGVGIIPDGSSVSVVADMDQKTVAPSQSDELEADTLNDTPSPYYVPVVDPPDEYDAQASLMSTMNDINGDTLDSKICTFILRE